MESYLTNNSKMDERKNLLKMTHCPDSPADLTSLAAVLHVTNIEAEVDTVRERAGACSDAVSGS